MKTFALTITMGLSIVSALLPCNLYAADDEPQQSYIVVSSITPPELKQQIKTKMPFALVTDTISCSAGATKVICDPYWKCCAKGGKCVDDLPQCN